MTDTSRLSGPEAVAAIAASLPDELTGIERGYFILDRLTPAQLAGLKRAALDGLKPKPTRKGSR